MSFWEDKIKEISGDIKKLEDEISKKIDKISEIENKQGIKLNPIKALKDKKEVSNLRLEVEKYKKILSTKEKDKSKYEKKLSASGKTDFKRNKLIIIIASVLGGLVGIPFTIAIIMGVVSAIKGDTNSANQDQIITEVAIMDGSTGEAIEENQENESVVEEESKEEIIEIIEEAPNFDFTLIPEYSDSAYYEMNENHPYFSDNQMRPVNYVKYSDLSILDRVDFAVACIDKNSVFTEETEVSDSIVPTGWLQKTYNEEAISGDLYKKIGLIGFALGGAYDSKENVLTSTKYMYEEGIKPFEEQIEEYVNATDNHVTYRVTPIFEEDYLIASGLLLEAKSVEDLGEGLEFCVYCYNVQPGIEISYEDGSSESIEEKLIAEEQKKIEEDKKQAEEQKKAEEAAKAAKAAETAAASTAVAATATQSQSSAPASGGMCWLSASGSKYHSIDHCGKMNPNKARQVTIAEAEASGMTRCSKCW